MFRKAEEKDIADIEKIYDEIISKEESEGIMTGWKRGIYPTRATAESALKKDELYVCEKDGKVLGTGIFNHNQVDEYKFGNWKIPAEDSEILVLHTLVISPKASGKGLGKKFIDFYNRLAKERNCKSLRIDTNENNTAARKFYTKLGFSEVGIAPCNFNGLNGINLVLLEREVI